MHLIIVVDVHRPELQQGERTLVAAQPLLLVQCGSRRGPPHQAPQQDQQRREHNDPGQRAEQVQRPLGGSLSIPALASRGRCAVSVMTTCPPPCAGRIARLSIHDQRAPNGRQRSGPSDGSVGAGRVLHRRIPPITAPVGTRLESAGQRQSNQLLALPPLRPFPERAIEHISAPPARSLPHNLGFVHTAEGSPNAEFTRTYTRTQIDVAAHGR